MPQRIITVYICSLCGDEYREDPSGTFTLTFADGRVLNYDACAACCGSDPLRAVLHAGEDVSPKKRAKPQRFTAPAPAPAAAAVKESKADVGKTGDFPCPECNFKAKNPQGLGAHRQRTHGIAGSKKKRAA